MTARFPSQLRADSFSFTQASYVNDSALEQRRENPQVIPPDKSPQESTEESWILLLYVVTVGVVSLIGL